MILLSSLLLFAPATGAETDGWELAQDEDGIRIYTRPKEGSRNIEFRGVVTVPDSSEVVDAVLEDVESYPSWYARCLAAETLERVPGEWRIVRMEIDLPFPVSDRDAVVRVERHQEGDVRVVRIDTAADAAPKVEGFVRMPRIEGGWRLEPTKDGTRVTYQQVNDPGGSLPAWLSNMLVTDQPATTLAGLRRTLDERRAQAKP
jgi:hypothetical protein